MAFLNRQSIASLVCEHNVSRGAIRTSVAAAQAIKPIMDLGLTLVTEGEGRSMALFKECIVRIGGATYAGPPTEKNESDRIEWVPLSEARGMIDRKEIVSRVRSSGSSTCSWTNRSAGRRAPSAS